MAIRFTDKEWEDIKSKSSGAYTSNEEELKDKAKMEHELDDDEMKKEQAKAERERKKSEREDKKFAKANPGSAFAKQYEKAHPKSNKQSQARAKRKISKGVGKAVGNIGSSLQPGSVPGYKSPDFNVSKSGYTPLDYKPVGGGSGYKPVDDKPYFKPMGSGATYQPKEYKPIFPNKVPMTKASKVKNPKKGSISPITGFMRF
jgi:hypothetical protein